MVKKVATVVMVVFVLAGLSAQSTKNLVRNGDFESENAQGWNIQFSEWGTEEEKAAWSLTKMDDNIPNKTQKLNLWNGLKNNVTFTMTQTIRVSPGDYVCSLIFEGGPEGINPNTTITVDGKEATFTTLAGWKNWKQVVIEDIEVARAKNITITVEGTLGSEVWMSIDDVEFVKEEDFTRRRF